MKTQKGQTVILLLVGMLVIVAAAGGAYYFGKSQIPKPQPQNLVVVSQTPQPTAVQLTATIDETANWKTYTASDNSFSISYPPAWELCDVGHSYSVNSQHGIQTQPVLYCDTNQTYSESRTWLRIYNPQTMAATRDISTGDYTGPKIPTEQLKIEAAYGAKALKDYQDSIKQLQSPETPDNRILGRIIKINGVQAVANTDPGGIGDSIMVSNGKDAVITVGIIGSFSENNTTDQILSTFKFLP